MSDLDPGSPIRLFTVEHDVHCQACGDGPWIVVGADRLAPGVSFDSEEGAQIYADTLECGVQAERQRLRKLAQDANRLETTPFRDHHHELAYMDGFAGGAQVGARQERATVVSALRVLAAGCARDGDPTSNFLEDLALRFEAGEHRKDGCP